MPRLRRVSRLSALLGACLLAPAAMAAPSPVPPPPPAAAPAPGGPAPAAPPPPLAESVVATVNDDVISTYDVSQRMRLLMVSSGVQPTDQNVPQFQREALRGLVDERLEMQEIHHQEKEQKFKIAASDEDVADDLARIAQGNHMTTDQFLGALANAGVGPETLKEQLRAQISWQRWIQGRYGGSRLKVSQDQVNAVFRQIEAEASKPQFQVSEIFLDAARFGGLEVTMNGAQQLIAQIQQGAPFAAVARQFSAAPTAANGGDAGWLAEAQMPEEVRGVVEELQPGQISRPIAVKDGVYIIQLRDKRAGAGADIVSLKQAAIALPQGADQGAVDEARKKLLAVKARLNGCDGLEQAVARTPGVVASDLGEAELKDLRADFRDAAANLDINQASDPIRTNVGLHVIVVCGKHQAGLTLPSRDEVEERLEDQQLSLISRRYLRDLRNSATIETR